MSDPAVTITAVLCTYKRPDGVRQALESLLAQVVPLGGYEVIVVDNADESAVRRLVEGHSARDVPVEYVVEPVLGLSRARNAALRRARGRYIAFLDDDAVASPRWLVELVGAFESSRRALGAVGGRVTPIWEAERPQWLCDHLLPILSVIDWSPTPLLIEGDGPWLAGTNLAFPTALLREIGGFAENLGRLGACLKSGEEALAEALLKRRGYPSLYVPSAEVGHRVTADRLEKRWHVKRFYWNGFSKATLKRMLGPDERGAVRTESGAARLRAYIRPKGSSTRGSMWFRLLCLSATAVGYVAALARPGALRRTVGS